MKDQALARAQAAVALATALTFWAALAWMPWDLALFDEYHVLRQVGSYGWLEIARNLMRDSHPPLYYWLVKGWAEIGGFDRPWAFRVFSLMLGLPALPLAFQIGRRLGGPRLGLALVTLLLLNPFYLFQLVLIRMYGLVITLGAWLTLLWLDLLRWPSRNRWAGWVLAQSLMLFTHYYGLFLILAQWIGVGVRRPRGWKAGLLISAVPFGAFLGWIGQAYGGTLEHTARSLSAIPVRPMPWEVIGHFWANLLTGPLADGRFAQSVALAMGILFAVSWRARAFLPIRSPLAELTAAVWLPLALGALAALRWPFFAARYFAMLLIPTLAWITWLLMRSRRRWALPLLLLPGLIGLPGMPLLSGRPLGLESEYSKHHVLIHPWSAPIPIIAHAEWLVFPPVVRGYPVYGWSDLTQRAAVVSQATEFWFIGVTPYRAVWDGWLQGLQATHVIDFQAEFDHFIPEYQASVFHLVRQTPPARWAAADVHWANGLRLSAVGWAAEGVEAGRSAQWRLRLSTDRPLDRRWTLFVHLVDEAGRLWANWDAEPDPPTDRWMPGQVYEIPRSLLIPRFVPAGRYRVHIGWYETGTPGFPRLPLVGGAADTAFLGELEVVAPEAPMRLGTRTAGPVSLEPPEVRVRPGPEGARIAVAFRWGSRSPAPFAGWQVVWKAPWGAVPLQRPYQIPEGAALASGGVEEVWVSPPIPSGRPALGWLEIHYGGHPLDRRPIWIFPPAVRWSYDWLFLNRTSP